MVVLPAASGVARPLLMVATDGVPKPRYRCW